MGTISLQSDPILPQGYLKVDGVTAATLTTAGLSGVLYRPATAFNGQILTYNGTTNTWVASAAPTGGETNNVDNTPIGSVGWFAAFVIPIGYLECNGSIVSKSQYSDLWSTIGNTFTSVVSANHFRLPDLRGEFIRGWDNGRGINVGRIFGSSELDMLKSHNHTVDGGGTISNTITQRYSDTSNNINSTGPQTTSSTGGTETRPRNVALLPCIKALKTVTGNVQSLNFIEKPASVSNGQVLTYNGSTNTWVASATPTGSSYTTVGDASAGIFKSAVCFIPSDPGTGTWTAPAGCYSARVTLVGGGGGNSFDVAGRSHFNYPSGSTTAANQMFANGGGGDAQSGGSAGWNGINNVAIGGTPLSTGGRGGAGGGGYGGGGGSRGTGVGGSNGGSYGGPGVAGVPPGGFGNEAAGGGGSGGVSGDGVSGGTSTIGSGGAGGGTPTLSYAAASLPNFRIALSQNVGRGGPMGCGGGWCSAIVSVVPNQSYSYAVGATTTQPINNGSHGMVVIEW